MAALLVIALGTFWALRQPSTSGGSAQDPEGLAPAEGGAQAAPGTRGHVDQTSAVANPAAPSGQEPVPVGAQAAPGVVDSAARVVGRELGGPAAELLGEGVVRYSSPRALQDEAAWALEAYRDGEPCILIGSGYLGVTDGAWGCLVQGDGWVEVRLVSRGLGEAGSEVTVVRMDVSEWERALVELDAGGE